MNEQTPQHDIGAEQAVLGSMMMTKTALWVSLEGLLPSDFYLPKHEVIARACAALAHGNEPVVVITVGDALL